MNKKPPNTVGGSYLLAGRKSYFDVPSLAGFLAAGFDADALAEADLPVPALALFDFAEEDFAVVDFAAVDFPPDDPRAAGLAVELAAEDLDPEDFEAFEELAPEGFEAVDLVPDDLEDPDDFAAGDFDPVDLEAAGLVLDPGFAAVFWPDEDVLDVVPLVVLPGPPNPEAAGFVMPAVFAAETTAPATAP